MESGTTASRKWGGRAPSAQLEKQPDLGTVNTLKDVHPQNDVAEQGNDVSSSTDGFTSHDAQKA